jgi:guanine nucleotide-binding protein G(I)/G(S)/G(T) subunit beta-1
MADIADRIAAARKEAEALKEKIKIKKDALADTTRTFFAHIQPCSNSLYGCI